MRNCVEVCEVGDDDGSDAIPSRGPCHDQVAIALCRLRALAADNELEPSMSAVGHESVGLEERSEVAGEGVGVACGARRMKDDGHREAEHWTCAAHRIADRSLDRLTIYETNVRGTPIRDSSTTSTYASPCNVRTTGSTDTG